MRYYDAVVIGGGVLGCFAARNLRRWKISTALIEAREDVCTGITRANTAIVYPGYDNRVGSRKAQMTVRANRNFEVLCGELEVPFSRCGSLMVSYGQAADQVLKKKLRQGQENSVPGLRILSGAEAREMEPMLAPGVRSALYAPGTGTVNPWMLGIGAYENALHNGCVPYLNTTVRGIRKTARGYAVETDEAELECRVILNCAGLHADRVQEMLFAPTVRIFPNGADYYILDEQAKGPSHILFHEPEQKGKGLTAVPTVEGNLMLGPSRRDLGEAYATTEGGLAFLRELTGRILPEVDLNRVIRSFGAVRPNPRFVELRDGEYVPTGKDIGSFVIGNPGPGFYSLIGIKTPGLTCSEELGRYLAECSAEYLDAEENPAFDPFRKAVPRRMESPDDFDIVCQCRGITRSQIREAIRRGAATVDGVKRRLGAGMGRCQGSRCAWEIEQMLRRDRDGTV